MIAFTFILCVNNCYYILRNSLYFEYQDIFLTLEFSEILYKYLHLFFFSNQFVLSSIYLILSDCSTHNDFILFVEDSNVLTNNVY